MFQQIDALVDTLRPSSVEAAAADPPAPTVGKTFAKASIEQGLRALEGKVVAAHAAAGGSSSGAAASSSSSSSFSSSSTCPQLFACGVTYPTVADACLVPQLFNGRRFGVNLDEVITPGWQG